MSDTTVNMIKAIHAGTYNGIKGKTLKLNKHQKAILNSKRVSIGYKGSGAWV